MKNHAVQAFGNGPPDPETATSTPPPPPPPPPPPAADICGDWYKIFYDHFEIYGKYFDATKFGWAQETDFR